MIVRIGRSTTGLALLAIAIGSSGCVGGLLYSQTTLPLDVNLEGAPYAQGRQAGSWKTVDIPVWPPFRARVDWGSIAIGDALEEAGIRTVHYADLETISVLGGIYVDRRLHVYGE